MTPTQANNIATRACVRLWHAPRGSRTQRQEEALNARTQALLIEVKGESK
jgi:hypothetical protein